MPFEKIPKVSQKIRYPRDTFDTKEKSYADCLCFLKQSLQRTGLFPFGSKGTVSLLPQFAQVIGKDCPEDIPRFPSIRVFLRALHAGHLTGAF
mgnify:FL=1